MDSDPCYVKQLLGLDGNWTTKWAGNGDFDTKQTMSVSSFFLILFHLQFWSEDLVLPFDLDSLRLYFGTPP